MDEHIYKILAEPNAHIVLTTHTRKVHDKGHSLQFQSDVQNVHHFLRFFKSLILQILRIYDFRNFIRYLGSRLYFGCRDFPH